MLETYRMHYILAVDVYVTVCKLSDFMTACLAHVHDKEPNR